MKYLDEYDFLKKSDLYYGKDFKKLDLYNGDTIDDVISINFDDKSIKTIPKWISKFKNLEILNISNTKIKKITNLKELDNLKEIVIENNKDLTNISELKYNKNLEKARLKRNNIKYIPDFSEKIKTLDLGWNQVKKIENLEHLVNLEELNLDYNHIIKIENLDKLIKLRILNLNVNKIKKIENLENLENLYILNLEDNQINKIEGLANSSVKMLYLSYNKIKIIENLDYKKVEVFKIIENPLEISKINPENLINFYYELLESKSMEINFDFMKKLYDKWNNLNLKEQKNKMKLNSLKINDIKEINFGF